MRSVCFILERSPGIPSSKYARLYLHVVSFVIKPWLGVISCVCMGARVCGSRLNSACAERRIDCISYVDRKNTSKACNRNFVICCSVFVCRSYIYTPGAVFIEIKSSGIRRHVDWYVIADVSDELTASVFRI